MADTKALGETVRRLRESVGLTQDELAHRVGIERSYLSHVERGKKNPPPEIMFTVLEALARLVHKRLKPTPYLQIMFSPQLHCPMC